MHDKTIFFRQWGLISQGVMVIWGGPIIDSDHGLLFPGEQGTQLSFMDAGSH